jgi:D-tyrosyl-tRNA(Tyr) deacylase
MIAVIQRVSKASVSIDEHTIGAIGRGLVILLGIEIEDSDQDVDWLIRKILALRIFNDDQGVMNLSVKDVDGELLIVSQFTLHASTRKGNRPSYIKAAKPDKAIPLYRYFVKQAEVGMDKEVAQGDFGADMQVSLVNDGPVTIIVDTKEKK